MKGFKTYLAAGALALFAAYGLFTGYLDQGKAMELLIEAAALAGLRNAIG